MFNGLIREIAQVASFSGDLLRLRAKYRPALGDSVAVNGACLSVTRLFADGFAVQLSSETARVIAVQNLRGSVHIEPAMRIGDRIDGHLIQGHVDAVGEIYKISKLASGVDFFIRAPLHIAPLLAPKGSVAIDGVSLTINEVLEGSGTPGRNFNSQGLDGGNFTRKEPRGANSNGASSHGPNSSGSNSVRDLNSSDANLKSGAQSCAIRLTIIPLTLKDTLFGSYKIGRRVNIETDLLARYVAAQLGFACGQPVGRGTVAARDESAKGEKEGLSWDAVDKILSLY
ncbi:riboflavin synthase [Campylobacter gracilis]|uniref:Riboflavin synthase n=1 Tax=Campylobacter gracilis RM3268 TaxID=553220 RepID=C8PJF7_9BACT|nr:riboflavin synthase [Campylobacter gracilis]AKT92287.1 6,7-dimethyl-8-ribityllumazine synthase (riboflavin synthase, alpha subunit) [Campylobacter gracilis]EEV17062.1 riboflavin synthase, alpha subunit [Campylobacter gracilis RM3268]SUW81808.1 riboflavin synthase subunit alpha [Campylobacter gracilis]